MNNTTIHRFTNLGSTKPRIIREALRERNIIIGAVLQNGFYFKVKGEEFRLRLAFPTYTITVNARKFEFSELHILENEMIFKNEDSPYITIPL